MNIEYTKYAANKNGTALRNAYRERPDNLLLESEEKRLLFKKLLDDKSIEKNNELRLLAEMAAQATKLWKPESTLKVYFFSADSAKAQEILKIASEWSEHCSIKFERTDDIGEAKIRVSFDASGHWSYVGTDALLVAQNLATMNFEWTKDNLQDREFKQVVLHEFGHALGLEHEHQSPEAGIKWSKSYVYMTCQMQYGWSRQDVDRNYFHQFDKTTMRYSELDRDSIMAYLIPPEFTLDGQTFAGNFELSTIDKKFIGELYPRLIHS